MFYNNIICIFYKSFFCRTNSLPNFLGTFVQPSLTVTNNNHIINNNNKPMITVVQTTTGFHKVLDDDDVDIPMAVDEVKLQQQQLQQEQTSVNLPSQLLESVDKSSSESSRQPDSTENNNRVRKEEVKTPPPSSPSFIDINNLPMVFDDTKLFQNVSIF